MSALSLRCNPLLADSTSATLIVACDVRWAWCRGCLTERWHSFNVFTQTERDMRCEVCGNAIPLQMIVPTLSPEQHRRLRQKSIVSAAVHKENQKWKTELAERQEKMRDRMLGKARSA